MSFVLMRLVLVLLSLIAVRSVCADDRVVYLNQEMFNERIPSDSNTWVVML